MTIPGSHPSQTPPLKVALIGGTGLGEAFASQGQPTALHETLDTPFGPPSGPILETSFEGVPVLLLQRHGPGHRLNPGAVPYRANIFALKRLGATHVLASGAVGSLREEYQPRHLVVPDQVIDKTTARCGTFYERAAVHVELAEPFCPVLRGLLLESAAGLEGVRTHDGGCYVCMEGPAFGTRAESHMHRLWGGDLIGMTLMPEAKLAREAELPYAAVCLVTDYDSWRAHKAGDGKPDASVLLREIIENLKQASGSGLLLIRRTVALMAGRGDELARCPSATALKMAIWSDKSAIDGEEKDRLWPLWGRYFSRDVQSAGG